MRIIALAAGYRCHYPRVTVWRVRGQVKHNSQFTAILCVYNLQPDTGHWARPRARPQHCRVLSVGTSWFYHRSPSSSQERYSSWQPGFYSGNQWIRKRKDNEQSIWYKMRSLWSREAGPWPPPTPPPPPRYLWPARSWTWEKRRQETAPAPAQCTIELETKVHPKVRNHGDGPN